MPNTEYKDSDGHRKFPKASNAKAKRPRCLTGCVVKNPLDMSMGR